MAHFPTINDFDFSNRKVLVRVDFNVPLSDGVITDDSRMKAALPTINKILKEGGSCVLMSHLGRPKNGPESKFSLKQLVNHLHELTGVNVSFSANCIGAEAREASAALQGGEILLLENLRFHPEEKAGDLEFSRELASLGDFYVNDAFGTAHRAHASTAVIAQFFEGKKCFGNIMANEVNNADKVLKNTQRPFTAIVGGAKVSDKLLILENLIEVADNILVGGGMAYTFLKAQGGSIGNSLVEDERLELTLELLEKAKSKGVNIYLPEDSAIANEFGNDAERDVVNSNEIPEGWMGLDIGPKAINQYKEVLLKSKTILWNGPMGVFEFSNFSQGTESVANAVANSTVEGAFSLIGGGDSAAAINKFNLGDQVSYVSTGGGALLEYFEGKVLPGIAAIVNGSALS